MTCHQRRRCPCGTRAWGPGCSADWSSRPSSIQLRRPRLEAAPPPETGSPGAPLLSAPPPGTRRRVGDADGVTGSGDGAVGSGDGVTGSGDGAVVVGLLPSVIAGSISSRTITPAWPASQGAGPPLSPAQ